MQTTTNAKKIDNYCFNPEASVFVSANAGSGKTRLLTNRVISLLLHGVAPSKILCLTFTNAAAAEMSHRILKSLGNWVMTSDKKLSAEIMELTGAAPTTKQLLHARSIFATVLEAEQGLRIETIHGFCQSLLGRFPIEASISPHFTLMDERSEQESLNEAKMRLFMNADKDDKSVKETIAKLARKISESKFNNTMAEIVKAKRELSELFMSGYSAEIIIEKLKKLYSQEIIIEYTAEEEQKLRASADILLQSEKVTDKKTGSALERWFAAPEMREKMLDDYISCFVTGEHKPRQKLFTQYLKDEELKTALFTEQKKIYALAEQRKIQTIIEYTADVLRIAEALLAEYEAIKRAHAWMDYDDLIITACKLLTQQGMSEWVLFKLDGGIDHILVDEAQDTSPEQWSIVRALTDEFFAGEGKSENARSLFVVGDEKQSIFSFQGADVAQLAKMQKYFEQRITDAGKPFFYHKLLKSYRSAPQILEAVDAVFVQPEASDGLTFDGSDIQHILTRFEAKGKVEILPLVTSNSDLSLAPPLRGSRQEQAVGDARAVGGGIIIANNQHTPHPNPPPQGGREYKASANTLLVRQIAEQIEGWISRGEAQPNDIMILLNKRAPLADKLVRVLKRRGVPVAGSDRMMLGDNLAVQDLLALGEILLLPDDDLTLASVLKSPIFNHNEDDIFAIAHDRQKKSIWEIMPEFPDFAKSYAMLSELRAKVDYISPFELYSYLLDNMGAKANFLGRMGEEYADPIDEFLQQTIIYEQAHPPSMQGFLHWMQHSNTQIKRDMEQETAAVRIMTVHGAKGLQAKIVILPDTTSVPQIRASERDIFFWENGLPVCTLESDNSKFFSELKNKQLAEDMREYRRLLYVALTRAEDRLYIYGASSDGRLSDDSWYNLVQAGLNHIELEDDGLQMTDYNILPLSSSVIRHPSSDFTFLKNQPPEEPTPSKPLTPSRLTTDSFPPAASPLNQENIYTNGKYIHSLMEHLPTHPKSDWEKIATSLAKKIYGDSLSLWERVRVREYQRIATEEKSSCVATPSPLPLPKGEGEERSPLHKQMIKSYNDAVAVIENPQFSFLFGADALSEVPITGTVELAGELVTVSGQIDKLYIGEKEVWIVDFKSNQTPPTTPTKIPVNYIRQLALYRLLMQKIMPEKLVRCALLWTVNARLDEISEKMLEDSKYY